MKQQQQQAIKLYNNNNKHNKPIIHLKNVKLRFCLLVAVITCPVLVVLLLLMWKDDNTADNSLYSLAQQPLRVRTPRGNNNNNNNNNPPALAICTTPSPAANWSIVASTSRRNNTGQHEACLVTANRHGGRRVYLIGGRRWAPLCEYHTSARTWNCHKSKPPQLLHHLQCLTIGNDIWIPTAWTGDYPHETTVDVIWIYHPTTDTWSQRTGLPPSRRRGAAAAVYHEPTHSIYVSHGNNGGHDEFSNSLALLDRYDIDTDTWTPLADGIIPRDHTGGAILHESLLCIAAGRNSRHVSHTILPTECYDITSNTWELRASIPVGRSGSAYGTLCDGRLVVAGGESEGHVHAQVSVFDGVTWQDLAPLHVARHGTGLAVDCTCNQMFIAGGSPQPGGPPDNGGLEITEHFLPKGVFEVCAVVGAFRCGSGGE